MSIIGTAKISATRVGMGDAGTTVTVSGDTEYTWNDSVIYGDTTTYTYPHPYIDASKIKLMSIATDTSAHVVIQDDSGTIVAEFNLGVGNAPTSWVWVDGDAPLGTTNVKTITVTNTAVVATGPNILLNGGLEANADNWLLTGVIGNAGYDATMMALTNLTDSTNYQYPLYLNNYSVYQNIASQLTQDATYLISVDVFNDTGYANCGSWFYLEHGDVNTHQGFVYEGYPIHTPEYPSFGFGCTVESAGYWWTHQELMKQGSRDGPVDISEDTMFSVSCGANDTMSTGSGKIWLRNFSMNQVYAGPANINIRTLIQSTGY